MNDYLLQLKTQVLELWQKMSKMQKIVIIGSAFLLFGTLIVLAKGAAAPDYGPLFTLKDSQEAGQVIEKLKEKKILYQISDSGTTDGGVTILVPTKDIAQTRLEIAAEGMPTGGVVGFENFDKTQFGETDTDRRTRYLRALQGELTRTIEGMAEVETARVHIVMPEPSLFIDEQKNATAAVMLKLKPYKTLEEGQVRGLVKLVTNSVEGLKSENVTIVDMAGNVLSEDIGDDQETKDRKLNITQIELRKSFQKEIQGSVQSMLEKIVGVGKAVVRVQLALDFDKIQQKKQQFGEKVPRSTHKVEETTTSTQSGTAEGTPGTETNIPGYVTPDQTGMSESTRSESTTNNEIDTFEEVLEKAPGSVKSLSVAVVVDKELSAKTRQDIENVVKAATGFQADRGDQISVAGMPFNTEYQDRLNKEIADAEKQRQMMIFGGLALVALLVIGGILGNIVIKRRRAEQMAKQLEAELAASMAEEFSVNPVAIGDIDALLTGSEVEEEPYEETEEERIKGHVQQMARENPGDVAQLLKSWLAEE